MIPVFSLQHICELGQVLHFNLQRVARLIELQIALDETGDRLRHHVAGGILVVLTARVLEHAPPGRHSWDCAVAGVGDGTIASLAEGIDTT